MERFSIKIRYVATLWMNPNDRRRKVKRRKGRGGRKKRKSRNNRSVKMNVPRRCSRPGYRDRFIKRWKSFVSASRGRVAINCNKKQKRYGHLVYVVQRFRSARQPLIDIYRRWKRFEKLKTGCCLSPFLGCASFHPIVPLFEPWKRAIRIWEEKRESLFHARRN